MTTVKTYRVWVTISSMNVRSGYLVKDAVPHHPATAQTTPNHFAGAIFASMKDANAAIAKRGWKNSTSAATGLVNAYVVEAL